MEHLCGILKNVEVLGGHYIGGRIVDYICRGKISNKHDYDVWIIPCGGCGGVIDFLKHIIYSTINHGTKPIVIQYIPLGRSEVIKELQKFSVESVRQISVLIDYDCLDNLQHKIEDLCSRKSLRLVLTVKECKFDIIPIRKQYIDIIFSNFTLRINILSYYNTAEELILRLIKECEKYSTSEDLSKILQLINNFKSKGVTDTLAVKGSLFLLGGSLMDKFRGIREILKMCIDKSRLCSELERVFEI